MSLLLAWHWQTVSNSMTLYLRLELHLPQMPWISSIRTVGPAAVAVAIAAAAAEAAAPPASSSAFSLLLVCASLLVYRLLPETITHLPTQLVCQPARLSAPLSASLTACLPFCPAVLPSVAVCLAILYSRQRMQSPYAINCRLVTTFPRKSVKV